MAYLLIAFASFYAGMVLMGVLSTGPKRDHYDPSIPLTLDALRVQRECQEAGDA